MLRDGLPYTKIIGFVRSKGHRLSKDALSHWFNRKTIIDQETTAYGHCAEATASAAKLLSADADTVAVLKELLARQLYRRRAELLQLPVQDLIYELRQLERLRPRISGSDLSEQVDALLKQENA